MGIAGSRHAADRFEAAMARPAVAATRAKFGRVEKTIGLTLLVCVLLALLLLAW